MAISGGFVGRDLILTWNGSTFAGLQETGLSITGEPVDITSYDDDGWQKLLNVASKKVIEITISGIMKTHVFKNDWFNGNFTRDVVLTYPDGATLSGSFFISTNGETGPTDDSTTFEATLMSTGEITFTPV